MGVGRVSHGILRAGVPAEGVKQAMAVLESPMPSRRRPIGIVSLFSCSLPSLLRGRRRRAYADILKMHRILWVASHMRLFLAAPEAINV